MNRTVSEFAWACLFVALMALLVAVFTGGFRQEPKQPEMQPQPADLRVELNLTDEALSACLNAFLRYGLGGPVQDYRCEVEGPSVELWGPAWDEYRQVSGGTPPAKRLGAVRMEASR